MAKIEKISIPSNDSVILRPGSLHIMIFNMPREVKEGRNFTLTLLFSKSGEKRVPIQFTSVIACGGRTSQALILSQVHKK